MKLRQRAKKAWRAKKRERQDEYRTDAKAQHAKYVLSQVLEIKEREIVFLRFYTHTDVDLVTVLTVEDLVFEVWNDRDIYYTRYLENGEVFSRRHIKSLARLGELLLREETADAKRKPQ